MKKKNTIKSSVVVISYYWSSFSYKGRYNKIHENIITMTGL